MPLSSKLIHDQDGHAKIHIFVTYNKLCTWSRIMLYLLCIVTVITLQILGCVIMVTAKMRNVIDFYVKSQT